MSTNNELKGKIRLDVRVAVVDVATGQESQVYDGPDPGTVQLTQLMCANVLNAGQTTCVKDTGNSARTVSANTAITGLLVKAGTGGTTAAVTDYAVVTTDTSAQMQQTGTVSAVNTTTGVFTVTANMAAPSSGTTSYTEIGLYVTTASYTFCVARTSGSWSVDTTHYLAVTYTVTPS